MTERYYGMLRPSEAVSLRLAECTVPDKGWGLLEFSEISSAAGRDWTDTARYIRPAGRREARETLCAAYRSRRYW